MKKNLTQVRDYVISLCNEKKHDLINIWENHLKYVEKSAQMILKDHPEANQDIVLLSVWLHDIGRLHGCNDQDHHLYAGKFVTDFLKPYGFDLSVIEKVKQACLAHRVKKFKPKFLEAKILATADALSHFTPDLYFRYFLIKHELLDDFPKAKEKLKKKIEHDFHVKIFFDEYRQQVKPLYKAWMKVLA